MLSDYLKIPEQAGKAFDRALGTQRAVVSCLGILQNEYPCCHEAYRTLGVIFQEERLFRMACEYFYCAIECFKVTMPHLFERDADIAWGYV